MSSVDLNRFLFSSTHCCGHVKDDTDIKFRLCLCHAMKAKATDGFIILSPLLMKKLGPEFTGPCSSILAICTVHVQHGTCS